MPREPLTGRWSTTAYLLLIASGIAAISFDHRIWALRFASVCGWVATAGWYLLWRHQVRRRKVAEQLAERARKQGTEPCDSCWHYACDGVDCLSCDGLCTAPGATRPIDHAYWLN